MLGEVAVGLYFELVGLGEGWPFRGRARVVPGGLKCTYVRGVRDLSRVRDFRTTV